MITNLVDQLVRDEGEILHAYQDANGFWTIGVGRLIDQRKGGGISQDESRYLLANDIARITDQLTTLLPWSLKLDSIRFAVLQAMAFNLGVDGLLQFHRMLTDLEDGNYDVAATEMQNSKWYGETGIRAQRLVQQMKTDVWM